MRKLSINKILLSCFLSGFSFLNLTAQEGQININEDDKLSKLLALKSEMSQDNEIGDRYKIQLFYGNNGEANDVIKDYRSKFEYPSLIAYEAPNYKVWVGNFRNRLEADRALLKIKESFPSAFIPKPRNR
ncbi:translation initiation factor IF-2 [Salegentibacter salinarum]|uniref:Translation initiation factor IF-2 n=1 Tax=Salegentibacter salinarum TaxID=447422 RepID=A0A2N0TRX2_9FLAO|nr:SPOR domain-containing protein [Salegentibacter salinarum]PKD17497.1 translation initiation factor IF-2 [Salegentibacter salinarum]SKB47607.1 Sporulation related domain-containing protein [Salegentibacter salinarum]